MGTHEDWRKAATQHLPNERHAREEELFEAFRAGLVLGLEHAGEAAVSSRAVREAFKRWRQ